MGDAIVKDFKLLAREVYPYMVDMRRQIHRQPCLYSDEHRTTALIAAQLDAMGIPYYADGAGNLVAKIVGGPGRRIALRADIDALIVEEQTGLPFASEVPSRCHACGHDIHAANLLGAAKILNSVRDRLRGTAYLCFQNGEEYGYGALEIIDYIKAQGGADTALAFHVDPSVALGTVAYRAGPVFSGCTLYEVTVKGRGGHGSAPWNCIDPVKPACEMLLRLSSLPAHSFSAHETLALNFAINGGVAGNIIPDKATLLGNVRFFNTAIIGEVLSACEKVCDGIAASYGVTCTYRYSDHISPPCISDEASVARMDGVLDRLGLARAKLAEPYMLSDNYAEFLTAFGGIYVMGGTARPGEPTLPLHHAAFSPSEELMLTLCPAFCAYTAEFLSE